MMELEPETLMAFLVAENLAVGWKMRGMWVMV